MCWSLAVQTLWMLPHILVKVGVKAV